jgi:hypothetical protein
MVKETMMRFMMRVKGAAIGGYVILQANTEEEAIELGRRFMTVHSQVLGGSYESDFELRQLAEMPPS